MAALVVPKSLGYAGIAGVPIQHGLYAAAAGADLLIILTEWNEFRALDLERVAGAMATPRLADLRNIYSAEDAADAGFSEYVSVGR